MDNRFKYPKSSTYFIQGLLMKHLQADLSTYAKPKLRYCHPRDNPSMALVFTYQCGKVKSKWTKLSTYRKIQCSLDGFTPVDNYRLQTDFIYYHSYVSKITSPSHCVVTLDMLEAWTAYFLEHTTDTTHIMYRPCRDAYPEYFL